MSNGEPSNAELERAINLLRSEVAGVRSQLSQEYVLAKVFEVVLAGLGDRVKRVEDEQATERKRADDDRDTTRRAKWASLIAAAAAVVGSVISAVVTAQFKG